MVFVFGLDMPLIEMFVLLSLLVLIVVVVVVVLLFKQKGVNRKLDQLLKEEHEIKEELDLTKMEEDKQLLLMRKLVDELGDLHLISSKKRGELKQLVDISHTASSLGPGMEEEQTRLMQQMIAHISNVNRTVDKESEQLDYIQQLIEREQQQFTQTQQQLSKKATQLNRAQAFNRMRDIK